MFDGFFVSGRCRCCHGVWLCPFLSVLGEWCFGSLKQITSWSGFLVGLFIWAFDGLYVFGGNTILWRFHSDDLRH